MHSISIYLNYNFLFENLFTFLLETVKNNCVIMPHDSAVGYEMAFCHHNFVSGITLEIIKIYEKKYSGKVKQFVEDHTYIRNVVKLRSQKVP